jgi:hypothetical protein
MRIWDISPEKLCRPHLLGEHRELHAIWAILTQSKKGYSQHPEVLRWQGKLRALYRRHEALVAEMDKRGYRHQSPIHEGLATGMSTQDRFVNTCEEQIQILKKKQCTCKV